MPQVINGCGTWYWGKSNISKRDTFCPECHRDVTLISYDTTHCVVIFFLPLVPMRRLRVIDECPVCHKHRVIKLKDWNRGRSEILPQALADWRRQKNDMESATRALGTAIAFQDAAAFDEVAAGLGTLGRDDPQFLVALADAHEHFGKLPEAEAAYRASFALAPNPATRNSLIINLLRQMRPEDAWPLLEDVLAQRDESCIVLLQSAAEGFQAVGKHDNALYVVQETLRTFPHLERDRTWSKLRRQSEKDFHSGKTRPPKTIRPASESAAPRERKTFRTLGRLIMPAVLVALAVWYVVAAYRAGAQRPVYVVSGLPYAYTAEVAGIPVQLPPMGRQTIQIPEGEIRVRVDSAELKLPDQTCSFKTGFLTRPFSRHTVIINPDQAALIVWEEVEYSANPDPNNPGKGELHVGRLLNSFERIDYHFVDFPDSLSTSSNHEFRRRVSLVDDLTPAQTLLLISAKAGPDAALSYLTRLPLRDPHEETLLALALSSFDAEALLTALRPLLDDRPLRVEAHRTYQYLMETHHPDHDLAGEYRALLAAEPDNSNLLYLCARATDSPAEIMQYNQRAMNAGPPCARARGALAYAHLSTGEFEKSLDYVQQAIALAPDTPSFHELKWNALLALARFDALLESTTRIRDLAHLPPWLTLDKEVCALALLERPAEAEARIAEFESENADIEGISRQVSDQRARLLYLRGQDEDAAALLAKFDDAAARFQAAAIRHDVSTAAAALAADPDFPGYWNLLVYAEASVNGDADLAGRCLDQALTRLRAEGKDSRLIAGWLSGERPFTPEEVLALPIEVPQKLLALIALGTRYPQHRPAFHDLARRLNFDRRFPHRSVAAILDKASGSVPLEPAAKPANLPSNAASGAADSPD